MLSGGVLRKRVLERIKPVTLASTEHSGHVLGPEPVLEGFKSEVNSELVRSLVHK